MATRTIGGIVAYDFRNINTATTTTVKAAPGYLKRITINTTSAGSITVYDNTAASGTTIGVLKLSVLEGTYEYDLAFATGLTIVTAGASDITVVYA